jgi:integrase
MTANALAPASPNAVFLPAAADKDTRSTIKRYVRWLDARGLHWFNADLGAYRDHLLHDSGLSKASAKKHLERVRRRYRDMLHENGLRDMLYRAAPGESTADRFAFVQEALIRLTNNTQYGERVAIKVPTVMHHADGEFIRLTPEEIDALLDSIPRDTLLGYRDAALVALAYACGLREAEAVAVTVDDLLQAYGGAPALRVRHGKGDKQRMVVYGTMECYLHTVLDWLDVSGITDGHVFRALSPDGNSILGDTLTARAFALRLEKYTSATPHDLRRSYARNLYLAGASVEFIRQQLGHEKIETSLLYIGALTD